MVQTASVSGPADVSTEQHETHPPIVAIAGRKGGAGKTTTALNLAGAFAEKGWRVLLVDLDPQASLTRVLLGQEHEVSGALSLEFTGIGRRLVELGLGVDGLAVPVTTNIDIYPGDRQMETAAQVLSDTAMGFFRLRKLLAQVRGYDVIIVDTPPNLGFALNLALLAAQVAVVPTRLAQPDFDALADTLALWHELAELNAAKRLVIVANELRADDNDRTSNEVLCQTYGELVATPIPHAVAVKRAINVGQAVVAREPTSKAARAYRALRSRVEEEIDRA